MNPHHVAVRDGLFGRLRQALRSAGIWWDDCYHEDRGDSILVLTDAEVPKSRFVESLPHKLAGALHEHNSAHVKEERIRVRVALHAGEVVFDNHGVAGRSVNLTFRLLEAPALKAALARSPGTLALIASSWFFDEVIRNSPASNPATYRPVRVAVKETRTVGWICLPDHPYPPHVVRVPSVDSDALLPRQLPAVIPHFIGRTAECRQLTTLLDSVAHDDATVVISAVSGTAGIGKTTLAVHWAHHVAKRFPDGQLYVNLRGFDPSGSVMDPAEALRDFLDALGVPAQRIPPTVDAQIALYRSLLVGRRILVLLDNARDTRHVQPLLPGSPGCLALVTSRNQLTGLVAAGAHPVTLNLLTNDESRQLLISRLGSSRVAEEPDAVDQIVTHCAQLPLALAIVAARAAVSVNRPLHLLANDLRDSHYRWNALIGDDPSSDVRAVFSWSYQTLSHGAAQVFRLLGLHPGPDISTPAAASLAGLPLHQARPLLDELARAHLIIEHSVGRYVLHDLLRAYAADQAGMLDTDQLRRNAIQRLLDHYLHTADIAARLLVTHRDPLTLPTAQHGTTPEHLTDHEQALRWFTNEYPVLLASVDYAVARGLDKHAWQLAWTLSDFLDRRGHWHAHAHIGQTALAAAQRLNDPRAQALAHRILALADTRLCRYEDAHNHCQQAITQHRLAEDPNGQAGAHMWLGANWALQGNHAEALNPCKRALALFQAADNRTGQADALNMIGYTNALLGDCQQAIETCNAAIALCQEIGYRHGEANTWDSLGYAYHQLDHHQQALDCYQHALDLYANRLGNRYNQTTILTHLGDTHHTIGNLDLAVNAYEQALAILTDLNHPDAERIRDKIHAVSEIKLGK